MNRILENLEAIRKKRGIKQEVIANRLGVTQQTYSGYFNLTGDMMLSRLQEICDIMEVNLVDVVTYPDKYVPDNANSGCEECKKKDVIINQMSNYIAILENRVTILPNK